MAQVNIQIQGLNKLRKAMSRAPREVSKEIDNGIKRSIITLERTAKQLVPVDTNRLRSSHRTKFGRLKGELFPTVKYAIYVHEGTSPHVIRPKNKKALFWKGASHPVKKVNHPGTQGVPWMTATANQGRREVERIIQKSVNKAIRKAFR